MNSPARIARDGLALHQSLTSAYQATCPHGWPTGPNDGYFFQPGALRRWPDYRLWLIGLHDQGLGRRVGGLPGDPFTGFRGSPGGLAQCWSFRRITPTLYVFLGPTHEDDP